MRKKLVLLITGLTICQLNFAQSQEDKMIRNIYDEALLRGHAYEDLRSLCKDIGPRLSGSSEAAMAIRWSL